MARKRARLTDSNDPLSATDKVLAGLEQFNQTSQLNSNSTSQEVEKSESQKVNKSNGSKNLNSVRRQVGKSASQEDKKSENREVENQTSQQVKQSVVRKATFQISEKVLNELDRKHLELQLELGKNNAPYKEVIVEAAISQLLAQAASEPDKFLKVVQSIQSERG